MQHHLPARHPAAPASPSRGRLEPEGELGAGQVPQGHRPAHLQRLGAPEASQLGGAVGDRDLEVQGVGQVQAAVEVDRPVIGRPGPGRCPAAGPPRPRPGRPRSASGSNRALASCDQPHQLRWPDLVRHRGDVGVHELRGVPGQAHGGVRDHPEPPRLQLAGLRAASSSPGAGRTPPPHWRQVPAPGFGGLAQGGGELGDRELRDPRTPGPAEWEAGLVPGLDRADQGVLGVHRRLLRPRDHHVPIGLVTVLVAPPRVAQHRGRVVTATQRPEVGSRSHRENQLNQGPPTQADEQMTAVDDAQKPAWLGTVDGPSTASTSRSGRARAAAPGRRGPATSRCRRRCRAGPPSAARSGPRSSGAR